MNLNNLLDGSLSDAFKNEKYILIIIDSKNHKNLKDDIIRKFGLFHIDVNSNSKIRLKNNSTIEFIKPANPVKIRGKHPDEIFVRRKNMNEDLKKVVYPVIDSAKGDLVEIDSYY